MPPHGVGPQPQQDLQHMLYNHWGVPSTVSLSSPKKKGKEVPTYPMDDVVAVKEDHSRCNFQGSHGHSAQVWLP